MIGTKVCTKCHQELLLSQFQTRGNSGRQAGQLKAHCKRCNYLLYKKTLTARKLKEIDDYKTFQGCVDCGYSDHPKALEFDHLPQFEKLFTIAESIEKKSREALWKEIAKCEVVCGVCHNIRTQKRKEQDQFTLDNLPIDIIRPETPVKVCKSCLRTRPESVFKSRGGKYPNTRHTMCNTCLYLKYSKGAIDKKRKEVNSYKTEKGCADCGYNTDPYGLEFDHTPGTKKRFNIGAKVGVLKQDILWEEIAKCEVVCTRCHNIRSFNRREGIG